VERWVLGGALDDLWEGDTRSVSLDGREILLCNVAGSVFAYDDSCPHLGNPLTCAAHEWSFDVRTGGGINPAQVCLQRHAVRIEGGQILIDMSRGDE
jgi:toluene monooxygenase system ferredoxin subunit